MKKKIIFSLIVITLSILAFGIMSASASTYGNLTYVVVNGEVSIISCDRTVTEANIPSIIEGYPVTSVGDIAFYNCTSLESITIPGSITSIGESAFYYCANLARVLSNFNRLLQRQ